MDLHDRSVYMTFEQHWTVRSVLRRALSVIREQGISTLWFKLLGETFYRRMWLIASSIQQIRETDVQHSDLRFRWLEREDLASYLIFRPDAGRERIRKRFSLGHRCFAAFDQDRIVFAVWTVTKKAWIPYLYQDLILNKNEAYFYEAWTSPAYRGRGIARAAMIAFLSSLKKDRLDRVFGAVTPENKAALGLLLRTGFRKQGKLGTLKIGKWRFEINSGQRTAMTGSQIQKTGSRNRVLDEKPDRSSNPDPLLLNLRYRAYGSLIRNWGGIEKGMMLRTDPFEETAESGEPSKESGEGVTVVGIYNDCMVSGAAAAGNAGSGFLCAASDIRNMPFADNSFDFVFSPSTLDTLSGPEDLKNTLIELHRVLKAGGRMIITLKNRQNLFAVLMRPFRGLGRSYDSIRFYPNAKMLRMLLAKAGFQLLDTTAILHHPQSAAAAMMFAAAKCGWKSAIRLLERILIEAQRMEKTSLRFWTGNLIAVHAKKPGLNDVDSL